MRTKFSLAAILMLFSFAAFSQLAVERLDRVNKMYDEMIKYSDAQVAKIDAAEKNGGNDLGENPVADKLGREYLAGMEDYFNRAQLDIKEVLRTGGENERKAARYFNFLYSYEVGASYFDMDKNFTALSYYKGAQADADYFSNSYNLPVTYEYDGKRYTIEAKQFEDVSCPYYIDYATLLFKDKQYDECLINYRKIINKSCLLDNERYLAYYRMLYTKKRNKEFDAEAAEYSGKAIALYATMSVADKKKITNPAATLVLADEILEKTETKNAVTGSTYYYMAGEGLQKLDTLPSAAGVLYSIAVTKGETDYHLKSIITFAKSKGNRELQRQALYALEPKIYKTDCDGLQYLADEFAALGENTKAAEYLKLVGPCRKEHERQLKKQQHHKKYTYNNSKFDFYAGFNVIGVMNKVPKMDFGGDIDFIIKRFGLEFAFVKINQDKDWMFGAPSGDKGKQYWDGYKGYLGLKGITFAGKGIKTAVGPLFGFVWKQNNAITSNVTENATNTVSTQTFSPVERQYQFLLNTDIYGFFKFFGMHLSAGIGGSYNQFDGKSPYYNSANYTVEHPLLQRKSGYFAPQFRVVFTMGLHAPFK